MNHFISKEGDLSQIDSSQFSTHFKDFEYLIEFVLAHRTFSQEDYSSILDIPCNTSELMFIAVSKNNLDLLKLSVEKGADLNYQSHRNCIMNEALLRFSENPVIIEYLLSLNLRANWVKNN